MPKIITEPCLLPDMDIDFYHAQPAPSSSRLSKYHEYAGAKARYLEINPTEPSEEILIGQGVHDLVLQPELAQHSIAIAPDVNLRTKAGREIKKQFDEDNAGKIILTEENFERALAAASAVSRHPLAEKHLTDIIAEHSIFWKEKETGELCRVRPDALQVGSTTAVDLKTTSDCSEKAFQRSSWNFGYHRQAAMYLEGINHCPEMMDLLQVGSVDEFLIIAVETKPPYLVNVFYMTPTLLDMGHYQFRKALSNYIKAKKEGYPGYPPVYNELSPPAWARWEQ